MSNVPGAETPQTAGELRVGPGDWPDAIADAGGPQLVVGGPGTGKTEFLVRRAAHLVAGGVDPAALAILSFGRRGVADLRARLRNAFDRSAPAIEIATFHSYASRLVEFHATTAGWARPPQILTGPEQTALVRRLLATEDPRRWPVPFRGLLGSTTFAREVTDFLLRSTEQLLDPEALAERARHDWKGLPEFLARYRRELRETGRIDYGELIAEAVRLASRFPQDHLRYLLVDEYQDTTRSQVALLERLIEPERNLTVAADPYQSIYSFRGATLYNVEEFPGRFSSPDGTPGRRLVLTTSFRTPRRILDAAVRVTEHDLPGAAGKVEPAAGEGRVAVHVFDQQTAEAEWIASEIERLNVAEGVPLGGIGVLVRSKRRFLPELSRSLDRRRIAHDPPDARLAEQPAVRVILDLVTASAGIEPPAEVDRAMRRILLGPLFSVPLGRLRDLERLRIRTRHSWSASIEALLDGGAALAEVIADPSWAADVPAAEGFWRIWSSLPQIRDMVADPARGEEMEAWSSLAQVIARWSERNPDATLLDYKRLLEEEEFEARPLLSYEAPSQERVTMTTLHQAKGLEFEIVFIADAVEGVFPDLRTRDSLLGVRHLLGRVPTDAAGYLRFRLQEERRLAYTAMTRARRQVVWTATATGFEDGRGIPSRFLPLVAGVETVEAAITPIDAERPPISLRAAESWLRRTLADPAAPSPTRLAALTTLAKGPEVGLRAPVEFSGVAPRGPDTGVVAGELVLSPSQADAYRRCPRRYVLERRLRVGAESTVYATFGTLVHAVLEAAERNAFERGDPRASVGEAIALLDEHLDEAAFGGPPFSVAWRRRGVELLERLYADWPGKGRVVGLERELRLELGGIAWVGVADRIEADDGFITIVDYKTSRQPITQKEAATSLQLAFYLLAARRDPELATLGRAGRAEMWFPLARGKDVAVRKLDVSMLGDAVAAMEEIGSAIAAERWEPRTNAMCDRCPVRTSCPAWLQGGAQFA